MFRNSFLALLILTISANAYSQKISNADFQKQGNSIEITYTLNGLKYNQTCIVDIVVSTDGGATFSKPLKYVKGDVGLVETNGSKKVVWNVFDEFESFEGNIVFDIKARVEKKKIPAKTFASYSFSPYSPFGIMLGRVANWGGYVRIKLNGNFTKNDYSFKNGTITDYNGTGYYEFNSTKNYSVYGVTLGGVKRISRNLFLYTGVGYGNKTLLWSIDEYSYVDFQKTGDAWVKNAEKSFKGLEFEAGGILQYKRMLFSAGASTFNGSEWELIAGIGFMF